jgi:hypothetical protein
MKRLLLSLILLTSVATEAHGTCHVALYQIVETEWWDGVKTSHYEFAGWAEVACSSSGATDFGTVGPPAAGPAGGSNVITNLIENKQDQYETYDCEVPDFDVFVTAQMYNAGDPSNNYPFAALSGGNAVAIISDELRFGLDQLVNSLDGRIPAITSAYRSPSQNTGLTGSAKCSAHTYGRAADLSIKDPAANNAYSCTLWNMFADAAQNWVEPWDDTIANGGAPHIHIDFTRAKNNPGECTGYP